MKRKILPIELTVMRKKNLNYLRMLWQAVVVLTTFAAPGWLLADGGAIGMAVANGAFQVDHSAVWGTATLFDGAMIETRTAASELQLTSGVHLRLASGSRATVYRGRMVLESGFSQLESTGAYEIAAQSLVIAAGEDTLARIRLNGERNVTVAALRGSVRVSNAAGLLVAEVQAGHSLDFEPQAAGATAATRASGCLLAKSGKLILVEQTTNVVLEVHGPDLEAEVGNRLEIAGLAEAQPPSVPGASQVIKVAGLTRIGEGGCKTVAKRAGAAIAGAAGSAGAAGTAAAASGAAEAGAAGTGAAAAGAAAAGAGAAAAGAGIGAGTVAVIGGVAAAATVGGLAAVGSLPGQTEAPPPASR